MFSCAEELIDSPKECWRLKLSLTVPEVEVLHAGLQTCAFATTAIGSLLCCDHILQRTLRPPPKRQSWAYMEEAPAKVQRQRKWFQGGRRGLPKRQSQLMAMLSERSIYPIHLSVQQLSGCGRGMSGLEGVMLSKVCKGHVGLRTSSNKL